MWLPWRIAYEITLVLVLGVVALGRVKQRGVKIGVVTAKELAIVMGLYGTWQYVREKATFKTIGAMENARSLWSFERRIHLPSEVSLQRMFIDNRRIMQFLDVYYGGLHVPAVGALLIWLFVRHRDKYSAVRTTLAVSIAGCLTIQALVPMAPPRFLPDLGFVDAGLKYGLSVYGRGGSGISNELSAMPSLHYGWALLVGIAAITISTSKWRWLVLGHTVLTILSVTITANHWWMDGFVAAMVLGLAYLLQRSAMLVFGWLAARYRPGVVVPVGLEPDDGVAAERPLTNVT